MAFSPRPNWPHLPLTLSGATAPCQRPLVGGNGDCALLAIRFYLKQHGGGVPRGTPLSGRLSPKAYLVPLRQGKTKSTPPVFGFATPSRPARVPGFAFRQNQPASRVSQSAKTSAHPGSPSREIQASPGRRGRRRGRASPFFGCLAASPPLSLPTKRCLGWGNCRIPRLARQGAIAEKLSRATGGAGAKKRRPALGAARRGYFGLGLGPASSQSSSAAEGGRFFSRLCRRF